MERSEKVFVTVLVLIALLAVYGKAAEAGLTHPLFEVRDWQQGSLHVTATTLENAG